jgi:hypothetical protein
MNPAFRPPPDYTQREAEALKNREVVRRVYSTDGWTELFFSCGHSANVISAVGEGAPMPCTECLLQLLPKTRGAS